MSLLENEESCVFFPHNIQITFSTAVQPSGAYRLLDETKPILVSSSFQYINEVFNDIIHILIRKTSMQR